MGRFAERGLNKMGLMQSRIVDLAHYLNRKGPPLPWALSNVGEPRHSSMIVFKKQKGFYL